MCSLDARTQTEIANEEGVQMRAQGHRACRRSQEVDFARAETGAAQAATKRLLADFHGASPRPFIHLVQRLAAAKSRFEIKVPVPDVAVQKEGFALAIAPGHLEQRLLRVTVPRHGGRHRDNLRHQSRPSFSKHPVL